MSDARLFCSEKLISKPSSRDPKNCEINLGEHSIGTVRKRKIDYVFDRRGMLTGRCKTCARLLIYSVPVRQVKLVTFNNKSIDEWHQGGGRRGRRDASKV